MTSHREAAEDGRIREIVREELEPFREDLLDRLAKARVLVQHVLERRQSRLDHRQISQAEFDEFFNRVATSKSGVDEAVEVSGGGQAIGDIARPDLGK
jgi:hypothetical protein